MSTPNETQNNMHTCVVIVRHGPPCNKILPPAFTSIDDLQTLIDSLEGVDEMKVCLPKLKDIQTLSQSTAPNQQVLLHSILNFRDFDDPGEFVKPARLHFARTACALSECPAARARTSYWFDNWRISLKLIALTYCKIMALPEKYCCVKIRREEDRNGAKITIGSLDSVSVVLAP